MAACKQVIHQETGHQVLGHCLMDESRQMAFGLDCQSEAVDLIIQRLQ
jgi:hypothetical protein